MVLYIYSDYSKKEKLLNNNNLITGPPFYFNSLDLLYVFIELEKKLGKKLEVNNTEDFLTIRNIIEFIETKIEE